jgi:hypothetical protein
MIFYINYAKIMNIGNNLFKIQNGIIRYLLIKILIFLTGKSSIKIFFNNSPIIFISYKSSYYQI